MYIFTTRFYWIRFTFLISLNSKLENALKMHWNPSKVERNDVLNISSCRLPAVMTGLCSYFLFMNVSQFTSVHFKINCVASNEKKFRLQGFSCAQRAVQQSSTLLKLKYVSRISICRKQVLLKLRVTSSNSNLSSYSRSVSFSPPKIILIRSKEIYKSLNFKFESKVSKN